MLTASTWKEIGEFGIDMRQPKGHDGTCWFYFGCCCCFYYLVLYRMNDAGYSVNPIDSPDALGSTKRLQLY